MLLTDQEINQKLGSIQGWTYSQNALEKSFEFKNFTTAFAFMTQVAFCAEKINHHPDWQNIYNRVIIRLNTHDAGGVTEKDFRLASKIDALS